MIDDYEINSATLAIVPIDAETSMVYENDEEYIVNKTVHKIIDENCRFFGSSYQGRCEGTKQMTGIKSKFPIILEESRNMIFFPTTSNRSIENSWIALNHIKDYKNNFFGSTVIFQNNKKIDIPISYYSFENQYYRASLLKAKLYERKNAKNR